MANLEYSSCSCALHELTRLVASNHQTLTDLLVDFLFFLPPVLMHNSPNVDVVNNANNIGGSIVQCYYRLTAAQHVSSSIRKNNRLLGTAHLNIGLV